MSKLKPSEIDALNRKRNDLLGSIGHLTGKGAGYDRKPPRLMIAIDDYGPGGDAVYNKYDDKCRYTVHSLGPKTSDLLRKSALEEMKDKLSEVEKAINDVSGVIPEA